MKNILFLTLALIFGTSINSSAQKFNIDNEISSLTIFGTSTLHDWKLNAEKIIGNAEFEITGKKLKSIKALSIEVPVEPMKSGLDAIDSHMRTAMTANNSSVVTFILKEVTMLAQNTIGGYTVQANGNITIIKNTKPVALQATIEMKDDGSIRIFGETHINMTDYGVAPPQAEMGSIKTEDEVKVVFDVVFVK
ncbi:hypothetical protein MNBD_BACTEROID06-1422 [hydrothermal vent metagenome]|uniref:Lipid/polyisoprenoid-binding YceI-like domain-containing protein n=1 Tax=hydrothermal vent metagenome TaxID=652676 RepID=A0A3B0U4V7_9ZZZZ